MNWRRRLYTYGPLIIWIGVIFYLSSSQGSMGQTSRFVRPILVFLFPSAPEEALLIYHGYVRKLAHLTEYAVLGFLAGRAFVRSHVGLLASHPFVSALVLLAMVAVLDETNQSFNPARTGSPFDVLIDVSGGVVAVLVFYLWMRRRT